MVSTHLKNIGQNGNLPQIGVKIKHVWNHHLDKHSEKERIVFQPSIIRGDVLVSGRVHQGGKHTISMNAIGMASVSIILFNVYFEHLWEIIQSSPHKSKDIKNPFTPQSAMFLTTEQKFKCFSPKKPKNPDPFLEYGKKTVGWMVSTSHPQISPGHRNIGVRPPFLRAYKRIRFGWWST